MSEKAMRELIKEVAKDEKLRKAFEEMVHRQTVEELKRFGEKSKMIYMGYWNRMSCSRLESETYGERWIIRAWHWVNTRNNTYMSILRFRPDDCTVKILCDMDKYVDLVKEAFKMLEEIILGEI